MPKTTSHWEPEEGLAISKCSQNPGRYEIWTTQAISEQTNCRRNLHKKSFKECIGNPCAEGLWMANQTIWETTTFLFY
jgi:hypothetical protein